MDGKYLPKNNRNKNNVSAAVFAHARKLPRRVVYTRVYVCVCVCFCVCGWQYV